uniref:Gustatory receptor n=1 Tax=Meteorus pulchricornis TaxID=51522 RepID=A0A346TLM1_9HYME|nr:gustatory receptor [Meteorus pulchricornis]
MYKEFTKTSSRRRRLSYINMEMMRNEQDVKVAWENTESEMSITELQERPLTTQLRESEQRTKKTSFRGPESPLYNATCPYFYIARVLGLAPYDFDDELLVPSIIYMMISIVWICLNTYLIYFVLLNFTHTGSEDRKILRFTEVFKAGFNYGVVIFELFRCLITRREVAAIWNGIQDFDEILNGLGYIREERKARIWVWSTLVAATFIYILINQIGMHTFRQSWLYDVSYLIIYVESAASVMKFSGFVMLVAERFNYLNEISIECTSKQLKRIMGTSTVDINTIETLHHHMLTVAENLNSAYSWSILLWLMNLFLHSVCNLYFVSSWIVKTAFKLDLMTVFLIWIISFSAQLFVLNYVCHYASSEVCNFCIIYFYHAINHLYNHPISNKNN